MLSLWLAACGGASSAPETTPTDSTGGDTTEVAAAAAPSCADVGANVKAQLSGDPDMPAESIDLAAEVLVTSCNEDAWSEEARRCGAEARGEEIESCKTYLSADVAARLDARMDEIF